MRSSPAGAPGTLFPFFGLPMAANVWPIPKLYLSKQRLSRALPVFKMLLISSWVKATHACSSGQRLIHIIREPKSFLNSWYNRYVLRVEGGAERVFQENLTSVNSIMGYFGHDQGKFTTFNQIDLLETELWRWRYFNELILDAFDGSDRYMIMSYRELRAEPLSAAQRIYMHCGLAFEARHAERVANLRNELFLESIAPVSIPLISMRLSPRSWRAAVWWTFSHCQKVLPGDLTLTERKCLADPLLPV